MRLFLMLTKQSEASQHQVSVQMGTGESQGQFPLSGTPVLMFWFDLFWASFLLTSCLMGLLCLVMVWCVGWAMSGKAKRKTGQKTWAAWGTWGGEGRVDPQVWGWEILASPQRPANGWEDLWKRFYSKDRAKLFPEVHNLWTRASGHKLQQKEFLAVYLLKKKKKNWVFWNTETGAQRGVVLHPCGFQDLTTKDLQQPDLALKLTLQAVALGDLQRSLPT